MKRIGVARVIGAIIIGAVMGTAGATAATAAPSTTTGSSSSTTSFVGASRPTAGPSGTGTAAVSGAPGAPVGTVGDSTNGVPIRPIINWIKNNASSLITPMKNAVKKGFTAFKNWWAGVAGWVKAAINAIASMTVQALFQALWDYFF